MINSDSPPLLLGIDGGGTSTQAWLSDPEGKVIGTGVASASNAKAVGLEAARLALGVAILSAFDSAKIEPQEVEVACFGVAGFDRPEDRKVLEDWNQDEQWAKKLVLVNDGDLVVAGGTPEGWGVGIIAGTGSIAVARTKDGRKARAGGWGHLIGDEGSAYTVALEALRLVARRRDGRELRGDNDELEKRLCGELGVESTDKIVLALYSSRFDRGAIARLAPSVVEAAGEDLDVIDKVLLPAGAALAEMVLAVHRQLDWPLGPVPLALAGSFLLSSVEVRRGLLTALSSSEVEFVPTSCHEPVRGALLLARKAL